MGGFILFWVYRDFDFAEAGDVLKHGTNWWWMLFSLLFGIFAQVFRGWRWRQTLEPLDTFPKRRDCVNAIFVSYAASLIVPRIGEVSRCGILAKYDDVSFAKSLGTVVTERLVDTLTILLITGIYRLAANADICHFSSTDRNEDTFHDASVDVRMVLYCLVLFHRSGDVTLLFTKDIILL